MRSIANWYANKMLSPYTNSHKISATLTTSFRPTKTLTKLAHSSTYRLLCCLCMCSTQCFNTESRNSPFGTVCTNYKTCGSC